MVAWIWHVWERGPRGEASRPPLPPETAAGASDPRRPSAQGLTRASSAGVLSIH